MALVIGELIGGQGGYTFSRYGGTDGRVVVSIKVWAATSRIKAIDISLSDGIKMTYGKPTKPDGEGDLRTKEFTFAKNERVTSLSLWGNGAGTRSGWIYFKTNTGRVFDFGMYSWGKKTEYPQNVASGIWAGIRGRTSSDIDSLGVVFLQPISKCKLLNVTYPTLQFSGTSGTSIIKQGTSKSATLLNTADTDENLTYEITSDTLKFADVTTTWIIPVPAQGLLNYTGTSFIGVEAQTPALVSKDGKIGWQTSTSPTKASTLNSTTSSTLDWNLSDSLAPSQSLSVSGDCWKGTVSALSFKGSLEFTTSNSATFRYSCTGTFNGKTYLYEPTVAK